MEMSYLHLCNKGTILTGLFNNCLFWFAICKKLKALINIWLDNWTYNWDYEKYGVLYNYNVCEGRKGNMCLHLEPAIMLWQKLW